MTIRKLPDQPGFMIRRLQQVAISLFHETLETAEITPVQYTILQILAQNRQLDQTAIAALAYLDASTTGDVLRRLEKRGLVCRTVKETDRRSKAVDITEDGNSLLSRIRDRIVLFSSSCALRGRRAKRCVAAAGSSTNAAHSARSFSLGHPMH